MQFRGQIDAMAASALGTSCRYPAKRKLVRFQRRSRCRREEVTYPNWKSFHDSSFIQPMAKSLYLIHYPVSLCKCVRTNCRCWVFKANTGRNKASRLSYSLRYLTRKTPVKNQFHSSKGREQQETRLKVILRRIFSVHQLQVWTGLYLLTLN